MSNESLTDEQFERLKKEATLKYQEVKSVHCPFLNEVVSFNAKGLDHIKLKRWNHARDRKDQIIRLKLLHLASEVIKKSSTLQGLTEENKFERTKVNSRWEQKDDSC